MRAIVLQRWEEESWTQPVVLLPGDCRDTSVCVTARAPLSTQETDHRYEPAKIQLAVYAQIIIDNNLIKYMLYSVFYSKV